MAQSVLVVYGSKYGATAEIAERIGETLRAAGLGADVMPARDAGDPAPYAAVIVGSAVYVGQWRKEAVAFLRAHAPALAQKPVWLFSSGPTGEGDPLKLTDGWRIPGKLRPIVDQIAPREIAVFHGASDAGKLNFFERWILKNVKAPIGDFRDWEAIAAWAGGVAAAVQE